MYVFCGRLVLREHAQGAAQRLWECTGLLGGAPEVFRGAQRHLGLPACFWRWILFSSLLGITLTPRVLTRHGQAVASRGVSLGQGGFWLEAASVFARQELWGWSTSRQGVGRPSHYCGLTEPQIPGEVPQSVPTTHADVGAPQPAPVAAKSPWQLQARGHNEVQTPRCAPSCSPRRCGGLI